MIATPYSIRETVGSLWRSRFGPNLIRNQGILNEDCSEFQNNFKATDKITICFVGDIMNLMGKNLEFEDSVTEIIKSCDYLVGNFEGVIYEGRKNKGVLLACEQRLNRNVTFHLRALFPAERTFLGLANNHAADFGKEPFISNVSFLEDEGFRTFGWKEKPFIDIDDSIRIIAGTTWSNQRCDFFESLENVIQHADTAKTNILFIHWGYEHEANPRPEIVSYGQKMLDRFQIIVGHHSHFPQAISLEEHKGEKIPICYSLGNFFTGCSKPHMGHGKILRVRFGKDANFRWRITYFSAHLIQSKVLHNLVRVQTADSISEIDKTLRNKRAIL